MNISYPSPIEYGYTIYIKSGCIFCEKVKQLLNNIYPQPKYIDCDSFIVFNKNRFLNFIKSLSGGIEHKTFPIVFLNKYYIGGYSETKSFIDESLKYK